MRGGDHHDQVRRRRQALSHEAGVRVALVGGDRPAVLGAHQVRRGAEAATGPYTATDANAGITSNNLQALQDHRGTFGTFAWANLADAAGSAGPSYAGGPGAPLVAPNLVPTDGRG